MQCGLSLIYIRILYIILTRETFLQGKSNVCHKYLFSEATRLRQPPWFLLLQQRRWRAAPSPVPCPSTDSDSTHQHRPGSLHTLLAGCWPPHSSYQRDCDSFILTNEEADRVNRFGTSLRLLHHKNAFCTIQSHCPLERWLSDRSWTQMLLQANFQASQSLEFLTCMQQIKQFFTSSFCLF